MSSPASKALRVPTGARLHASARMELGASLVRVQEAAEACGALVGRWSEPGPVEITGARVLCNVTERTDAFAIDPAAIRSAARTLSAPDRVIGFWHTHPSGLAMPSPADCREHERFLTVVSGRVRAERAMLVVVPGGPARWSLHWYAGGAWLPVPLLDDGAVRTTAPGADDPRGCGADPRS